MIIKNDDIVWLQYWYYSQCNGDWEHGSSIHIGTLDNPGWSLSINIEDTELENFSFSKIDINRTENNWVYCFIKNKRFEGNGGPLNLCELISIFRNWAESGKIETS